MELCIPLSATTTTKETLELTLKLKFHVFIKILNKEKIKLIIDENSKIVEKRKNKRLKIHVEKQKLTFLGDELDDYKTLLYYNIKLKSFLNLNLLIEEKEYNDNNTVSISVKTFIGKVIPIEIEILSKIENFKSEIEKIENIPKNSQQLFFLGKELEDKDNLIEYDIKNYSTINLSINHNKYILIELYEESMENYKNLLN